MIETAKYNVLLSRQYNKIILHIFDKDNNIKFYCEAFRQIRPDRRIQYITYPVTQELINFLIENNIATKTNYDLFHNNNALELTPLTLLSMI